MNKASRGDGIPAELFQILNNDVWTGRPGVLQSMGSQSRIWLSDWTELNWTETMMLLKCYTQYARKFGKFSNGHRTRKGQFSFQSHRKAMTKNVQTTAQLHSSHKLAKWYSKFSRWGFNSTRSENFQMFKLDLEKAEEPEIKLQHLLGHRKRKRVPEKHLLLL